MSNDKDYQEFLDKYENDVDKTPKRRPNAGRKNRIEEIKKGSRKKRKSFEVTRKEIVDNFSIDFDSASLEDEPTDEKASVAKTGIYFSSITPRAKKTKKIVLEESDGFLDNLRKNTAAFTFVFLISVFLTAGLFAGYMYSCLNDVLAINRSIEEVEIEVPENATTNQIINILRDNKLLSHTVFCKAYTKIMGYENNYLNGVYKMSESMGVEGMLMQAKEKQKDAEVVQIIVAEGKTVQDVAKMLQDNDVCTSDMFYKTLREVAFDYPFISEIKEDGDKFQMYEGYLYPDTYEFFVGENANSVIRKFLDNFKLKMTTEYIDRAKELGMSIDDVIALASVIQREAGDTGGMTRQMHLVSSVLHNRLKRSNDYPNLQCDSTYEYFINNIEGKTNNSLKTADEYSPLYNTYIGTGLPAGAICNPGPDAIYAALYPSKELKDSERNYLYFRHDRFGNIYMAKTFIEHEENGVKVREKDNMLKTQQ